MLTKELTTVIKHAIKLRCDTSEQIVLLPKCKHSNKITKEYSYIF